MTIQGHEDCWLVRIAGIGNYATGIQTTWCTRRASGYSTALAGIVELPTIRGARVSAMEPRSSDADVTIVLEESTAQVLLRQGGTPYMDASGAPARGVSFLSPTDTSLTVSDGSTFTAGDRLWYDGEVLEVTVVTGDVLTVVRGRLGTHATAHPFVYPGILCWQDPPRLRGSRVTVIRVALAGGAETVMFRGIVLRARLDGTRVLVEVGSPWRALGQAKYAPPRALAGRPPVDVQLSWTPEETLVARVLGNFDFDRGRFGELAATWWRIEGPDNLWAVCTGTLDTELLDVGGWPVERYLDTGVEMKVVQVGRGDVVFELDSWRTLEAATALFSPQGTVFRRAGGNVSFPAWREARIRYCWVREPGDSRQPSDLLGDLLGQSLPHPMCLGIATAEQDTDSFDALDLALSVVDGVRSPHVAPGHEGTWIAPWWPDDATLAQLLDDILAPLGCALAPGNDGRLRTWSWTAITVPVREVEGEHIAGRSPKNLVDEAAVLSSITYEVESDREQRRHEAISVIGAQLGIGGAPRTYRLRALASAFETLIEGRVQSLIAQYERETRRTTLALQPGDPVQPGQVVRLRESVTDMPGADGVRGSSRWRALVCSVSTRASRFLDVEVLLMGTDFGGGWAPALQVMYPGYSGGKVYAEESVYGQGAKDIDDWDAGTYAVLLDETGAEKAMTATLVNGKGTDGTGDYLTTALTTSAERDLVVLADYDETDPGTWAWLADGSGTLGAAGAPGVVYE